MTQPQNPLQAIAQEGNPNTGFALPTYRSAQEMLAAEVKAIGETIFNQELQSPRFRYPEARFRKYFAPFFLGVYEAPKEMGILTLWLSETGAGSQHTEVDIVDSNGNVLFVIPPLLNTSGLSIEANANAEVRFNGLNNIHKAESLNNPVQATVNFFNGVSEKLSTLFNSYSVDPSYAEKWKKIYEFYGVPYGNQQTTAASNTDKPKGIWENVEEPDFG